MTRLARSGLWMPLMVLVLIAIVGYQTGWIWPLMLCFAIGLPPWFAASRAFDDNVTLRAELARRDREDAARMESRLLSGETVPSLRIVRSPIPMQRRGDEWDAIVRAVEDES